MPGRLSPAMLALAQSPTARWCIAARWDLLSGTRYIADSPGGVRDAGGRDYEGVVEDWGTFVEDADIASMSVSTGSDRTIVIKEKPSNPWLSTLLARGGRIAGSVLHVYFAGETRSSAWTEIYVGVCAPPYQNPAPHEWRLHFAPLDAPMRSSWSYELNESNRPTIAIDKVGQSAPEVWGRWDSLAFGTEQKGCITAIRDGVGSVAAGYPYTLTFGRVRVPRAYRAGVLKLTPDHYSVSYDVMPDGRLYTRLIWLTDPGSDPITADVDGYGSGTDGLGATLTNEVDIFEHLCHNRIFNRTNGAVYYTRATAPVLGIDTDSFDAAKLLVAYAANGAPRRGGVHITRATSGLDLAGRFSVSTRFPLYWNMAGKLAIMVDSPFGGGYVTGAAILPASIGTPITYPHEGSRACDRVRVTLGNSAARMTLALDIGDSTGGARRTEDVPLSFFPLAR